MSGQSNRDAAKSQDQMEDQGAFRGDPRGRQEVSGQQPETQQSGDGDDRSVDERPPDEATGAETGRDDAGEATGNPPNAG